MAADGKSFGIALGVNAAIGTICFLFFCLMRLRRPTRKFYMPRQFKESTKRAGRPYALPKKFAGWIGPAWATSEEEIVRVAGYDAAMYIKILTLAFEVVVWVSVWCIIIALPTNLVGREVAKLTGTGNVPTSPFTYWVPPPSPPPAPDAPPAPSGGTIKAPNFYAEVPPAPPGLEWWSYNPGVPPLPNPQDVLGPNYSTYFWRYNKDYSAQSYTFSQLDKVTMSNVAEESNLLWVHAIACYFVVWVILRALWRYSRAAVRLHLMYLSNAERAAESHSILVREIPGTSAGTVTGFVPDNVKKGIAGGAAKSGIPQAVTKSTNFILPSSATSRRDRWRRTTRSNEDARLTKDDVECGDAERTRRAGLREPDIYAWERASQQVQQGKKMEEIVATEYEELFPDDVAEVHMVYKTAGLDALVKEYDNCLRSLEDLIDSYASQKARRKDIKRQETKVLGVRYGEWGRKTYPGLKPVKTDTMDWYVKRLTELRRLILEEQGKCTQRPSPTAFVTFRSCRSRTIAANSLQHPDVSSWHVASAPEPNDIIWGNVRHRMWERQTRKIVVWVLFILMALFYSIPIGAMQGIIEVQRLSDVPVFKQLVSVAFVRSLIEAILPGLVLNIFLAILPLILSLMSRQQGMISLTAVDFGVMRKYFIFLIVTVFLGSFIGGALFNQFNQWVDDPKSAVTILGLALPLTSIFFLTYITLQAFTSLPLSFLRLIGLVLYWVRSKFAATPRAKARVWSERRYQYGPQLPRHMLILFVALVFSIINPLVPIMSIVYFAVALLTERYNMLYVFTPIFESGGKMFVEVYEQIISAVFFFEVVMIALLAIKKSFAAILVAPLIVVTFIFWRACKPMFWRPMSVLSLRTAVDMDHNDRLAAGEVPLEAEAAPRRRPTYLMPAMDFDEARHQTVLQEALDMDLVLQGKKDLDVQRIGKDMNEAEDGEEPLPTGRGSKSNKDSYSAGQASTRSLQPLVQGNPDSASPANLDGQRSPVEVVMVPLNQKSPDDARNPE